MPLRLRRWALVSALLLVPVACCQIYTRTILGSDPSRFVASYPNDLPEYWHEIATYRTVGWNGGYYTHLERVPSFSLFHFGAHGPVFPMIFGTLARFTGWTSSTFISFNLVAITLSLLLLAFQLDCGQLLATLACVLTFWPLHLFAPTAFQESFHQAIGIVLAIEFHRRYFRPGRDVRGRRPVALLALIFFASLVRLSWSLLLMPVFFLEARRTWPRNPRLQWAVSVGAWVASTIALLEITSRMQAPGGNSIFRAIHESGSLVGIASILRQGAGNAYEFLGSSPLIWMQQVVILMFIFGIPILFFVIKYEKSQRHRAFIDRARELFPEAWLHWFNFSALAASCLLAYLPAGYYRIFAPHLAFSLFLLILNRRVRIAIGLALVSGSFAWAFPAEYRTNLPNFSIAPDRVAALREAFGRHLTYELNVSPWCNTILTTSRFYDHRVAMAPDGFGISWIRPGETLDYPMKSRYLLLGPHEVPEFPAHLRALGHLPDDPLTLYVNEDAPCP